MRRNDRPSWSQVEADNWFNTVSCFNGDRLYSLTLWDSCFERYISLVGLNNTLCLNYTFHFKAHTMNFLQGQKQTSCLLYNRRGKWIKPLFFPFTRTISLVFFVCLFSMCFIFSSVKHWKGCSFVSSKTIKILMGEIFWKIKNKIASIQSDRLCGLACSMCSIRAVNFLWGVK